MGCFLFFRYISYFYSIQTISFSISTIFFFLIPFSFFTSTCGNRSIMLDNRPIIRSVHISIIISDLSDIVVIASDGNRSIMLDNRPIIRSVHIPIIISDLSDIVVIASDVVPGVNTIIVMNAMVFPQNIVTRVEKMEAWLSDPSRRDVF